LAPDDDNEETTMTMLEQARHNMKIVNLLYPEAPIANPEEK
jgi:hypothetical protein